MDLTADGGGFRNIPVTGAAGAICSFLILGLLRSLLLHTTRNFSVLAQLLFLQLVLHVATSRGSRSVNIDPQRLALSATHRLARLYVAVQALRHFGLLFAFLLQHADVLLLQIKRWYSVGDKANALLLLLGYLLVAGVNLDEYGALLHTLLLIGAAVGLHWTAHLSMLQADGNASLFSIAGAMMVGTVLAYLTPESIRHTQQIANDRASADGGVMSLSTWTLYLVVAALSHFAANFLTRQINLLTLRDQEKAKLVFTLTGIVLAIFVAVVDSGWVRGLWIAVSCCLVLYVLMNQWRRLGTVHKEGEVDLDTYRFSSACKAENGGLAAKVSQVLAALWAKRASRQMLMFLSVNIVIMFVELGVGLYTNSLGLMGDAGHMLFDNGALMIGLVASYIGQWPPDALFTYGYGRVEVLSGFLNSLLLLLVSFHLFTEAASRFLDPPKVTTDHLLLTSMAGLLVNLVGLFFFHDHVHHSHGINTCGSGHGHSHGISHHQAHGEGPSENGYTGKNSNMYGVYLHVLADTLGSVGVIISSILIHMYEWHVADSASSALISLLILGSTLPLLRDTAGQLLQGAPQELQDSVNAALQEILASIPEVERIAQWNLWHHAGNMRVATLHLEVAISADEQQVLQQTRYIFRRHAQLDKFLSVQISKPQINSTMKNNGLNSEFATVMNGCSASHSHSHGCSQELNCKVEPELTKGMTFSMQPQQRVSSSMSTHENPEGDDFRYMIHHVRSHEHGHKRKACFHPIVHQQSNTTHPSSDLCW